METGCEELYRIVRDTMNSLPSPAASRVANTSASLKMVLGDYGNGHSLGPPHKHTIP